MEFLRVDSQFSVIEAALKGYMKWADANALEPVVVSLPVNHCVREANTQARTAISIRWNRTWKHGANSCWPSSMTTL